MKRIIVTITVILSTLIPFVSTAQSTFCNEENALISIRNKITGDTEELIFTFKQPAGFDITQKAVKPPFTNYGGDKVKVKGSSFREIHFQLVAWTCETHNYTSFTSLIAGMKETERFEGYITYVVGLNKGVSFEKQYTLNDSKYRKVIFRFRRK